MYRLTKEDTGRIGAWYPDHEKSILATFKTEEEALAALRRHHDAILHNELTLTHFGTTLTWLSPSTFTETTNCPTEQWVATTVYRIEKI